MYRHVIKILQIPKLKFTEIYISMILCDSCHDSLIPAKISVIPKAIDVIRNRGGPLEQLIYCLST